MDNQFADSINNEKIKTSSKRQTENTFSDDEEVIEEEKMCDEYLKREIFMVLKDISPEELEKLAPYMDRIDCLTENQAKSLLTTLEAIRAVGVHAAFTKRILGLFCDKVIPDDIKTKEEIINDKALTSDIGIYISKIIRKFSPFSALCVLGIYVGTSYINSKKRKRNDIGSSAPEATFQRVGVCKESIGEDNSHGKTNEQPMGTPIQ